MFVLSLAYMDSSACHSALNWWPWAGLCSALSVHWTKLYTESHLFAIDFCQQSSCDARVHCGMMQWALQQLYNRVNGSIHHCRLKQQTASASLKINGANVHLQSIHIIKLPRPLKSFPGFSEWLTTPTPTQLCCGLLPVQLVKMQPQTVIHWL